MTHIFQVMAIIDIFIIQLGDDLQSEARSSGGMVVTALTQNVLGLGCKTLIDCKI